jgi:glyoxylase-like metal-dependent hydrolase (beta-lactamase superfamily II)
MFSLAMSKQRRKLLKFAALAPIANLPFAHARGIIGRFTSEKRAYHTHSYWIEGRDGLILIDTQFLPSDALKFVELAEATTGKKAKLAVVLHPNPDKFNGVANLTARGIDVVTSEQVAALIDKVHAIRLGWFYNDYKPDYPQDAPKPRVFGNVTTTLNVAGVSLNCMC